VSDALIRSISIKQWQAGFVELNKEFKINMEQMGKTMQIFFIRIFETGRDTAIDGLRDYLKG